MTTLSMQNLILNTLTTYGGALLVILGAVIGIGVAYLVFRHGWNLLWHSNGTTNWLGSHWSWYDHISYSPWKGYKRFHSRKWNMEHTMN